MSAPLVPDAGRARMPLALEAGHASVPLALEAGHAIAPLVAMERVSKAYRGVPAVRDVDFDLAAGEIHALLGENGAGKSTLTKMLAGVVTPTGGRILLDGRPALFATPHAALEAGVAMVFQETSLVPSMTVAQNLTLGSEPFLNRLRGVTISAQQFLQSLNFGVDPTAMVETLGAARRQMVEIARAVYHDARVIIFDEPTASLTPEEKRHFFALLQRLKARGVAIVFISHALEEALAIADRITILRDGERVAHGPVAGFDRASIVAAMVGRTLTGTLHARRPADALRPPGRMVLSVQDISQGRMVRNTAFSVFAGQITGVFGLIGSGRTETFKIVAGITRRDFRRGGTITLEGRPVRYATPAQAVADGVVYITEDRKSEGFFETMSIAQNLFGGLIASPRHKGAIVRMADMRALAAEWTRAARRARHRRLGPRGGIVRRQPAEGGDRQGPGAGAPPRDLRRAHARRRRGGHRGDPFHRGRARGRRARRGDDLLLPARGAEPLGPDPGLPPGPHRGGDVARWTRPRRGSCTRRCTEGGGNGDGKALDGRGGEGRPGGGARLRRHPRDAEVGFREQRLARAREPARGAGADVGSASRR